MFLPQIWHSFHLPRNKIKSFSVWRRNAVVVKHATFHWRRDLRDFAFSRGHEATRTRVSVVCNVIPRLVSSSAFVSALWLHSPRGTWQTLPLLHTRYAVETRSTLRNARFRVTGRKTGRRFALTSFTNLSTFESTLLKSPRPTTNNPLRNHNVNLTHFVNARSGGDPRLKTNIDIYSPV